MPINARSNTNTVGSATGAGGLEHEDYENEDIIFSPRKNHRRAFAITRIRNRSFYLIELALARLGQEELADDLFEARCTYTRAMTAIWVGRESNRECLQMDFQMRRVTFCDDDHGSGDDGGDGS